MLNKVVITGIGYVLPEGYGTGDTLQEHILQHRDPKFSINEDVIKEYISERLWDKIDSFSRYALVAAKLAVEHARLSLDKVDMTRCGCFVGNTFGGWKFTERELQKLYSEGARFVSPYQATSWFPAAVQGQLSLFFGIKGFSKTYMSDRASGLISLISAAEKIADGTLDIAIAGGTESTNTAFLQQVLSGMKIAKENDFKVSEGSVFLILENEEHAKKGQRNIHGYIKGYGMANYPCSSDKYCDDKITIMNAMKKAAFPNTPALVFPDLSGQERVDKAEEKAIMSLWPDVKVNYHKAAIGHTFGAEGALDTALACTGLGSEITPSTLINSKALGGLCVSLLVSKEDL